MPNAEMQFGGVSKLDSFEFRIPVLAVSYFLFCFIHVLLSTLLVYIYHVFMFFC